MRTRCPLFICVSILLLVISLSLSLSLSPSLSPSPLILLSSFFFLLQFSFPCLPVCQDMFQIMGTPVNVEYSRQRGQDHRGRRDEERSDWTCFKVIHWKPQSMDWLSLSLVSLSLSLVLSLSLSLSLSLTHSPVWYTQLCSQEVLSHLWLLQRRSVWWRLYYICSTCIYISKIHVYMYRKIPSKRSLPCNHPPHFFPHFCCKRPCMHIISAQHPSVKKNIKCPPVNESKYALISAASTLTQCWPTFTL